MTEETEIINNLVVSQNFDAVFWIILGVVFFIAIMLGIWILIWVSSHKHKFRAIMKTDDSEFVVDDKAKILSDKDGKQVWHLLKLRKNANPPPKEAIKITNKGHFAVEAVYNQEEESFLYRADSDKITQTTKENFTTNQKIFAYDQYKKAQLKRKQKLSEMIMALAPMTMLAIVIVMLLIFAQDYYKPAIELAESNMQTRKIELQIVEELKDTKLLIQSIEPENLPENIAKKERPD